MCGARYDELKKVVDELKKKRSVFLCKTDL
jgi:hypothetical protein